MRTIAERVTRQSSLDGVIVVFHFERAEAVLADVNWSVISRVAAFTAA
jgi:hypothetical protein